jgi:5-formyltetrahydrofolate cyclo-ligase
VSDTGTVKRETRALLAARRRQAGPDALRRGSVRICARLLRLPEIRTAKTLAVYAALPGEVELTPLIRACQKRRTPLLLPRFNVGAGTYEMVAVHDFARDTVRGHFGIHEPLAQLSAVCRAELLTPAVTWLVPGLGFDGNGHRLGRGKGFYDRLLRGTQGPRIGVAFGWQMLPAVPAAAHDVRMHLVVTDEAVYRPGKPPRFRGLRTPDAKTQRKTPTWTFKSSSTSSRT